MKKQFILFSSLLLTAFILKAQQPSIERYVIASAGGSYTDGSNLAVDYTIGEVAILTLSNATNFLTQGFQQPYESGVFINDLQNDLDIFYYPNPVTSELNLNIIHAGNRSFNIELFDLLGQKLTNQSGIANNAGDANFIFDMHNLATGHYLLRISSGSDLVRSIKILKISY